MMAQLSEILAKERERKTPAEKRIIYLYADGSFYRAYDWSAWLFCRYVKQLKVNKKHVKSVDSDMLFVGFPQSSLERYLLEGMVIDQYGEKNQIITLLDSLITDQATDVFPLDYQNWQTTIPLTEPKERLPVEISTLQQTVSLTGIMKQVMEYSVEKHSPIDCMLFLVELKGQLARII